MIRTIFRFSQNWYPIPSLDVKSPMVLMAINLGLPDVFLTKPSDFQGWSDILGLNSVFGGYFDGEPPLGADWICI